MDVVHVFGNDIVTFLVINVFPYDVWHRFPLPEFC